MLMKLFMSQRSPIRATESLASVICMSFSITENTNERFQAKYAEIKTTWQELVS